MIHAMLRWGLGILAISGAGCYEAGQRLPSSHCREAAQYNRDNDGCVLMIMQQGRVVFEDYASGWTADRPHRIASGTKSFWGPLAAAAIEDGILSSLDAPASDVLTEWRDDPRKSTITIRQLLNFTSGLEANVIRSREEVAESDVYAAAVAVETVADPGTKWSYGPTHHSAFAEVLRRSLDRETVRDYLDRRLLGPLEIEIDSWLEDAAGNPLTSSGVRITARQWAKWGEFIRRGGLDERGKALIPAALLAECFEPSEAFPAYGLGWWVTTFGVELPADFAMAAGAGKQQLYVIPSWGLTVVRLGEQAEYENGEILSLLLYGTLEDEL